jgi:hypothetical protein
MVRRSLRHVLTRPLITAYFGYVLHFASVAALCSTALLGDLRAFLLLGDRVPFARLLLPVPHVHVLDQTLEKHCVAMPE